MNIEPPLQVALVSLGCPKNLVDSEKMLADLAESVHVVGAPLAEADVIVVNTCCFVSSAREESLEVISEAVEQKSSGRCRRVVVAGCLSTREREKLFQLVPGVDAVLGVDDRDRIVSAVTGSERFAALAGAPAGPAVSDSGRFRLTPPHTAYLRVSEGCSHGCTFCTIPAIRGPFRSKRMAEVTTEARELVDSGAVELNVIGQDTTSFGRDLPEGENLPALLRALNQIDGLAWIRLLYTYPRGFSDELVDTVAECDKVIPYVDMPLQHISTPVLKRMGRGIDRARTERVLTTMRERIPGLVLRTTFIVGFPGETDEQFQELLEFVQEFRFENMGAFAYSAEEGTPAADFQPQVPEEVKQDRLDQLMLAQQQISFAANERMTGRRLEVLIDGVDAEGICLGRYYGQAPAVDGACLLAEPLEPGQMVTAEVAGSHEYDLVVQPM
ncbi:MAG: 30S ribosomal protein S12 methylthiotransferase RimO [Planctomycetota bacterium]